MTEPARATQETRVPNQVTERVRRAVEALKKDEPPQEGAPTPVVTPPVTEPTPPAVADATPKQYTIPESELLQCPPERLNDAAYWRQRASIVNGFLKKDRERYESLIAERDERIAKLKSDLAQAELKAKAAPTAPVDVNLAEYFTPEQIEQVGEDNAKVIATTAARAAQRIAAEEVRKAVEPMQQRAEKSTKDTHEAKMREFDIDLAARVPNYQVIDQDPLWLHWLEQDDVDTGMKRGEILTAMVRKYNAAGVARMFEAFLNASGQRVHVPAKPPEIPAGNAAGAGGGDIQPAVVERYPSPTEIREFYKRASLGKVSQDERAKFEARLKAAQ